MQGQQKSQKIISSSQNTPTHLSGEISPQISSQRLIYLQKTHLDKCEEKVQVAPSLNQINLTQEDVERNDKCSNLLLQSRNYLQNTPNKQGSIEVIKSPNDKVESEEEFLNKVIAEEEKNRALLYQQSATVNRKGPHDMIGNEDEPSLLPLASIVKFNTLIQPQESLSSESDNNSEHKTKISKNHEIATLLGQSFQSQYISEDDETLNKCQNCQALQQKTMTILAENNQYVNKINILMKKYSILKNRPQSPINIEVPEIYEDFQNSSNSESFSDQLKSHMRMVLSAINQIRYPSFHQVLDFDSEDKKLVGDLMKKLKFLLNILQDGKQDKCDQEMRIIPILHDKYKKYIEEIQSNYEKKIDKLQQDFKHFIFQLKENSSQIEHPNLFEKERIPKNCKIKKKVNSCERYQIHDNVLHLKEKLQHLQYTSQEEKKKIRILQRQNKLLAQKYTQEINDLKNQKNYYASTAKRYQTQFLKFMQKATNHPKISLMYYEQFFKEISQRVFEISNCIPFEENDQQNLFVPQSQDQLFDMIQRIRRFSLTVEAYYSQKDKEFCNLKKSIAILFKRLLDNEKVSFKAILDVIKNSKDLQLDYLRDYLCCLRKKKIKAQQMLGQPKKKQIKLKSLSLQKVDSLTFLSDQAHRNSESQ